MSTPVSAPTRTLADDLRARDDEALETLFAARPDLVSPVPADMTNLVARATTRTSVLRALDALDQFTLQVLDAVAHQGEPATLATAARLVPAPKAQVRAALARLRERALIWGPDDALRLVRTVREVLGAGPGGTGPPLAMAAAGYPAGRLQQLLADLGRPGTADPPSALESLARTLGDPAALRLVLADAPSAATELLAMLDAGGGIGRIDRADRDVRTTTAGTPVEWLLARGVLVALDTERVALPAEVAVALRAGALYPKPELAPPPATAAAVGVDAADGAAAGQAMGLVRAIEDLLDEWALSPPAVLRTGGGLGVRDLRRVALSLDGDAALAALVVEVAYAAGLLASDGAPVEAWLPTPAFDRWRAMDTPRRWVELASAWLGTSRVVGLVGARDGAAPGRDRPLTALGRELDRALAPEIRHGTIAELAELPAGATTSRADVLARLVWRRPRRGGALREDLVGWTLAEAEQLGVTGRGALSSFARPLLEGDGESAAARLTPLLPQPLDHVLLQADLTAVATGPLRRSLSAELALAADVESTGGATVYRFSDASIRRALDAGRSAADLHELFRRSSRTPVPQPLTYLIDDVARRHGRIRVGSAEAYVRCDDEAVIAELISDRRAERLGLRRLAPTVAIAGVGVDALLAKLREVGYAPAAESSSGAVVLRRPDSRRTGPRTPPRPVLADRPPPTAQLRAAAVRALRAGDRAATVGARVLAEAAEGEAAAGEALGSPAGAGGPERATTTVALGRLRAAAEAGASVWLGYVGDDGTATDRIVDPIAVEGGILRAFDHRQARVRSFSLARISAVADA